MGEGWQEFLSYFVKGQQASMVSHLPIWWAHKRLNRAGRYLLVLALRLLMDKMILVFSLPLQVWQPLIVPHFSMSVKQMSFLERNNICHRLKRSIVSQTKTQVARVWMETGENGLAGGRSLDSEHLGSAAVWLWHKLVGFGLLDAETHLPESGRRQNSHPSWWSAR